MLNVSFQTSARNCNGVSRRDFVRAGVLGATGLSLPTLLRAQNTFASSGSVKDKSVVFLFLAGGPSQYETFDPKMTAPAEVRSVTGEIATNLPGVTFAGMFPQLARHADRLAIVRSFQPDGAGIHEAETIRMLTGGTVEPRNNKMVGEGASIGAIHARIRGMNHPVTGAPAYAFLQAPELDEFYINFFLSCAQQGSAPGGLGPAYAPFTPTGSGPGVENLKLNIPADRLTDRRRLLSAFDRLNRNADHSGMIAGLDRFSQQAFNVLAGDSVRKALDLSQEDPHTLARYDTTSHIVYGHKDSKLSGASKIGTQLLTARRLCEAGCRFVTVASSGWDMHGDGNNPNVLRGTEMLGPPLDQAVAAFLEDVEARGLTKDILIVITGEFGRTPRLDNNGGRSHWAGICPLLLAGGGLNMGQVVGQSAKNGDVPATDPITIRDLMATITHTVFDVGQLRLRTDLPSEIVRLAESGRPIQRLLG
ncbi:MAG TPA: DUF1501 domain-containing protein [Pirellulales bacterium]|nr:DUF1501 domain-containing protein [Pirellulales bacterium]